MPELPEVETIRRALEPAIAGRTVVASWSHPSAKFTPATTLDGARLGAVGRRGKYLLVAVTGPDRSTPRELVVHLGMTGGLRLVDTHEAPSDPYVRATLDLGGETLEYRDVRRFGRLRVVAAGDHAGIPTLAALGPEPLSEQFTPQTLYAAVAPSRRAVKTQLLSQRPVAGLGNIYADEALWMAGVGPARRRISRAEAGRLHDAIRTVIAAAIDRGGTTLRDYRTFDGGTGRNQDHLACYGRAGLPCPRCQTPLRSRVLDARTTTWCPTCQSTRRSRAPL